VEALQIDLDVFFSNRIVCTIHYEVQILSMKAQPIAESASLAAKNFTDFCQLRVKVFMQ
jgi:hypothetical protein